MMLIPLLDKVQNVLVSNSFSDNYKICPICQFEFLGNTVVVVVGGEYALDVIPDVEIIGENLDSAYWLIS